MSHHFRRRVALTLAGALAAGHAHAQAAQTPEGAQAFLNLVAGQGTTRVDVDGGRGWNRVSGTRKVSKCYTERYQDGFFGGEGVRTRCNDVDEYSEVTGPSRALQSATVGKSTCETQLKFADYGAYDYVGQWKISPQGYTSALLNWGKVAKVTVNGAVVSVSPSQPTLQFVLPSSELATRLGYAMEFLRQRCDPTAATGF